MSDLIKALEATRQHELKTDPEVFDAVRSGLKTHEIRRNDRDFKVGDTLLLRKTRYTGQQMHMRDLPLEYTGDECTRVVSHVLDGYGLQDGWVILSFADHEAALEAVQAEPKAWVTPMRYGSAVTFYKPPKPVNWDDSEFDWYCYPLYAEPPLSPQVSPDVGAELLSELKDLRRAYVRLIESGRDRIRDLGGDCDPVDVMERNDPYLRKAVEAIQRAEASTGSAL